MLKKNDKLLHGYFNELKERLNAELAKRGGQGSVYGYQNKIDIAQIAGDVSIDQWAHTQGTDINTGISTIQPNVHYTLASEMNDLLNRVASWKQEIILLRKLLIMGVQRILIQQPILIVMYLVQDYVKMLVLVDVQENVR